MDWQKIIKELIEMRGMTQAEIGRSCDIPQPTVSDLLSGKQKDIRFVSGIRLLALFAAVSTSND